MRLACHDSIQSLPMLRLSQQRLSIARRRCFSVELPKVKFLPIDAFSDKRKPRPFGLLTSKEVLVVLCCVPDTVPV
jgi:hypothetical protein